MKALMTPLHHLHDAARRHLGAFHLGQGGAIAFLALAALLVLAMTAFVLNDAGHGSRDKIDVQMAADTAAFSQASVRARSMNMLAFANIGKRTTAGIHNVFYLQPLMYLIWWANQCSKCCCLPSCFFARCVECLNCAGNIIKLIPIVAIREMIKIMFSKGKLKGIMKELGKFQEDLAVYTPYWALGEGMVRGMRNGAHAVGSFPEPKNTKFGRLPVKDSKKKRGSCTLPFLTQGPLPVKLGFIPATSLLELYANHNNLKQRSSSKPSIARKGPREVITLLKTLGSVAAGCFMLPKEASPYMLTAKDDRNADDLFHRSNFVITYRHSGDMMQRRRDYDTLIKTRTDLAGLVANQGGFGSWSLARSEVFFPKESAPKVLGFPKPKISIFMFHPGWLGKLRPLTIPGEGAPSSYGNTMMSKGFEEAEGLMFQKLDYVQFIQELDPVGLFKDRRYGKKAFKSMDGKQGGRLMTDGLGK